MICFFFFGVFFMFVINIWNIWVFEKILKYLISKFILGSLDWKFIYVEIVYWMEVL